MSRRKEEEGDPDKESFRCPEKGHVLQAYISGYSGEDIDVLKLHAVLQINAVFQHG
jgi:hypothetical protein